LEGNKTMKNMISLTMLLFVIILVPAVPVSASHLVSEPSLEMKLEWDLLNTGMLFVHYDTNGDGKADYRTVRIVARSNFSGSSVSTMEAYYPDYLIFTVRYPNSNYYYIVEKEPVLYAIDSDEDGTWDNIYKDVSEDGVNGNEILHVSY
jgi:hypothetical protein